MSRRSANLCTLLLVLTTMALGSSAFAGEGAGPRGRFLLRTDGELEGAAIRHRLKVLRHATFGDRQIALVEPDDATELGDLALKLDADPDVAGFETSRVASLPELSDGAMLQHHRNDVQADLTRVGTIASTCWGALEPWSGFGDQHAATRVRLRDAQLFRGCGAGTVALIDTGVDPDHPLLAGALVEGYDFLAEEAGLASEWSSIDHSLRPLIEELLQTLVGNSLQAALAGDGDISLASAGIAPILDQADVAMLEGQPVPPAFGHGTMVAGILRLAAPGAKIMPLRVFDGEGLADLFDVVRAIYWAVDNGAEAINMSFSIEGYSEELEEALEYARARGVVSVAAAGNQGKQTFVFPAALYEAIGVAAVDDQDLLAGFSNFGVNLAMVAAPGSGVVSSYPGGLYAAGWGTSFSTPFVTGTVALIHRRHWRSSAYSARSTEADIFYGSLPLASLAGAVSSAGRLDALGSAYFDLYY